MSKLSDFLYYDLYPTLFIHLSQALPEFGFRRTSKGYQSTSSQKITGEHGEKGKVYVYENNISRLIDYTRNSISIFDYVQQRDKLSNAETLLRLAQLSGIPLPHPTEYLRQDHNYEQIRLQSQIWEDAHQYFIYLLNDAQYAGPKRDELRQYLNKRGYTEADIQAMQLGYIPSFEKLFIHLTQTKQHNPNEVRKCILLHENIGNTHCLAIPYRDAIGQIRGIIARSTQDTLPLSVPKYLYSTGLKKNDTLFNIKAICKNQAHIIIVEGLLDALHAEIKGIAPVVALGGASLNAKHIHQLTRHNPAAIILCLDNDTAGKKATTHAIQNIAEHSHLKTYIAQLPNSIKDPDQCLKELGTEILQNIIQQALPVYKYRLQQIIETYLPNNASKFENTDNTVLPSNSNHLSNESNIKNLSNNSLLQNDTDLLNNSSNPENTDNIVLLDNSNNLSNINTTENTNNVDNTKPHNNNYVLNSNFQNENRVGDIISDIEQDSFLREINELIASLKDPFDRDRLLADCLQIAAPWGITQQSLEKVVQTLQADKETDKKNIAFAQLISHAQRLKTQENTEHALQFLQEQGRLLLLQNKATLFEHLTTPITEQVLVERLSNKPQNLQTGYNIAGEELTLPAGALSILCAPTAHGKTTFLLNILLNLVNNYPNKQIHLFSYEEDNDSLLLNALNIFTNKEIAKNNRKAIKAYFFSQSEELFHKKTWEMFHTAKQRFFTELIATKRLNIHYIDYDTETLIDALHYLKQNEPVGAVLIDYMQLLHKKSGRRYNSRQEELKDICLNLKNTVIETGLPVVLAAQFNREVINPALLHPTKIGEAGDIERIAHLILGIWNNNFEAIGNDIQLSELKNNGFLKPNTLYVKLLKNRGGVANLAELFSYNGNTGKIENMKNLLL